MKVSVIPFLFISIWCSRWNGFQFQWIVDIKWRAPTSSSDERDKKKTHTQNFLMRLQAFMMNTSRMCFNLNELNFYRMCSNREILDLLPCLVRTKNKHIGVFDTLEWVTHLSEQKTTETLTHLWDAIIENTWNWKTKSATIWKYAMEFVFLYLFSCDHLMQIKNEYTDFSAL